MTASRAHHRSLLTAVAVVLLGCLVTACGDEANSTQAVDEPEDPVTVLLIGDSIMNQAGV